jgi:hypothetical protein
MALDSGQEYAVDLGGKAAIDAPLEQIGDAIAEIVGQDVALGIERGGDNWSDQHVTGDAVGSSRFLAYGGQEATVTVSEYQPDSGTLFHPWQGFAYVRGRIEARDANVAVDPRLFSRILFLDEVKAAGNFSRETVDGLFNIPAPNILTSGVDLNDVSGSQAQRVVAAIREQYAAGEWRNALQLAVASKHLGHLVRYAAEVSQRNIITVSDQHLEKVLGEEFGEDVQSLALQALRAGIEGLRTDGRDIAANHGEQWLTLLEEGGDFYPPAAPAKTLLPD